MRIASRVSIAAALLAVTALALSACGSDDDSSDNTTSEPADAGLQVLIKPAVAAPGDTVEALIDNGSEEKFEYGPTYELERQEGEDFVPVKLPDTPVQQIAYVAPAGSTGPSVKVEIPEDVLPGQYRVVIQRDVPDVGDLSGELEVRGDY